MSKVLIGCEFSGIVRDAFIARGHEAVSCDLLPSERLGPHLQADILTVLEQDWDMLIAFPPCTHLCSSGARWWKNKALEQSCAIDFFLKLATSSIPSIAIENPVGIMSTRWRKPDQIIQPWQFGDGFVKTTCLWLKHLPKLVPTEVVEGRLQKCWRMPPSPVRGLERSRTYLGIAEAMAYQWG